MQSLDDLGAEMKRVLAPLDENWLWRRSPRLPDLKEWPELRSAWRALYPICSVFAAIVLISLVLLARTSVGSAQTLSDSPVLSPEHLWMANIADEAAARAEGVWRVCISRAVQEFKGQSNEAVDRVQKLCENQLTNALDARTAALWIRFRSRSPDMFMPSERAKEHAKLVNQIVQLLSIKKQ